MENKRINKLYKIINCIFAFSLILIWLMPVSNQQHTLNVGLSNQMYICIFVCIFVMFFYDLIKSSSFCKRNFCVATLGLVLLIIFSLLTTIFKQGGSFGLRELLMYTMLFIVLGHRFKFISASEIWRKLFYVASTIIALCGILMIVGNSAIWNFFSTYYVNHYSYSYALFESLRRPVTFFAANSTSCPVYFIIYFIWELCEKKHKVLRMVFRGVYVALILACFNNSAILCVALIAFYTLFHSKKLTYKRLIINSVIIIGITIAVMMNIDYFQSIFSSKANGILGRYTSSGAGNLVDTIKYILDFNMPIGCVFFSDLYATDSGLVVYALRGSVILDVCIYYLLYRSLKYYISDQFTSAFLFISILGFEVGYPILIEQRFLPFLLFAYIYIKRFAVYEKSKFPKKSFNVKRIRMKSNSI